MEGVEIKTHILSVNLKVRQQFRRPCHSCEGNVRFCEYDNGYESFIKVENFLTSIVTLCFYRNIMLLRLLTN
jgi:hypothetical protein